MNQQLPIVPFSALVPLRAKLWLLAGGFLLTCVTIAVSLYFIINWIIKAYS